MVVSVEQLWKAESPMAMRLRGSLMVVIEWQTAKAQSPIVVRLSGSVMEARCAHKKRLRRHTPSGSVTWPCASPRRRQRPEVEGTHSCFHLGIEATIRRSHRGEAVEQR